MSQVFAPLALAPVDENLGLTNLLLRIPHRIRDTFTPEQIEALAWATAAVETRHVLAKRSTLGVFGKHFYFALFVGRCRRHRPSALERFIHSGLKYSKLYRAVQYAVLSGLAFAGAASLILGLYVAKSMLHIDLMAGPSPLHDLVF